MSTTAVRRKAKKVTVRVDAEMHSELTAAAERAGMPVATLARAFFAYGLATIERGDGIEWVLEGSRQVRAQRTVRGSRDTDKPAVTTAGGKR